jgi:hypothetical protein
MISFKEFLKEDHDYVFNGSPGHLKNIARRSPHSQARFVIHHDGRMEGGDAGKYTHHELGGNNYHSAGIVYHKEGKYKHITWKKDETDDDDKPHESVKRFATHGIEKG